MRKRSRAQFDEPSLVPLADMLTNTVGIMVFILIFTVLTAGGAVVTKRLPIERQVTVSDYVTFICANGRAYPLGDALIKGIVDQAREVLKGRGQPRSVADLEARARAIGTQKRSDEFLDVTLTAKVEEDDNSAWVAMTLIFEPRAGAGATVSELSKGGGLLGNMLKDRKPSDVAVTFWVRSDAIPAFLAGRDFAVAKGFASNWFAEELDKPISITLGRPGGGRDRDDGRFNFTGQ